MLIVTRLKLSNICQYDEIDIPIATGLMAVCGRNGSGKSTLLRGLMYGLTGLVDGSWGTQQNLQKDGVAVPGYVGVIVKDDRTGHEYIIKRYATSGAKFADSVTEYADGNYKEVATRRKTVDAYLGDLYGIPVQLLFQLVWGRQGQLDLLLTAPAAYVSTFLSGVFDTKYLEVLRDKLKNALSSIAAYDDMSTGIAAAQREKEQLQQWITEQQQKVDEINEKLTPLYDQHTKLQQQMNELSRGEFEKTAVLQAAREDLLKLLDPLDRLIHTPEYDDYRELEHSAIDEAIVEAVADLDGCAKGIEDATRLIVQQQDAIHKCTLEKKDVESKLVSLTDALNTVAEAKRKLADSVFHDGTDNCILCRSRVADTEAYVKQLLWLVGYEDVEASDVWDKPFNDRIAELQQQINEARRDKEDIDYAIKESNKTIGILQNKSNVYKEATGIAQKKRDLLRNVFTWQEKTQHIIEIDEQLKDTAKSDAYEALNNAFEGVCNDIQTGA